MRPLFAKRKERHCGVVVGACGLVATVLNHGLEVFQGLAVVGFCLVRQATVKSGLGRALGFAEPLWSKASIASSKRPIAYNV